MWWCDVEADDAVHPAPKTAKNANSRKQGNVFIIALPLLMGFVVKNEQACFRAGSQSNISS